MQAHHSATQPPRRSVRSGLLAATALAALLAPAPADGQAPGLETALSSLELREIGPAAMGGRVSDLAVVEDDPSTFYVGYATGGLWRTDNHGASWTPVFDDQPTSSIGAVSLAPSNPNVVWVGTGEPNIRSHISVGKGVYRSTDAGRSWDFLGLENTGRVSRIQVDPRDPDVLYAAGWHRLRWGGGRMEGAGRGSGIWKTTDGGRTWSELTNGIPSEDKGRIGLAIAPTDPRVLVATIETARDETTGTYRTEDAGATWRRVNELNPRPMYYSHIFIDPTDEDRVYVLGTSAYTSDDGGRTFRQIAERATYDVGVHADHHALWIDPEDPDHLYLAGDAGLHESYDRGARFRKINNFPIAQFYAIGVDMRDPYWVYGGLQDNHSFMGPSQTRHWSGIIDDDWWQTGFGDGMYWDVDPTNFRYAYGSSNGGTYFRLDPVTGDMLDISPREPPGEDYRFDWTSPLMVSRHDPATVYVAGNRLFISRDRGVSWERTEDL
ncbi:MAG: glycosyl hydrolase, partial [Gemmatimonadetes bacterium]|nr:glycosyl hydrolase [Gemmatimonadota bacterium]